MQTTMDSKVTSMPRVLVNDNEPGIITNERQEPTTKTTTAGVSGIPIQDFGGYVNAGTTLSITPHISETNYLQLEIVLDVDSFEGKGVELAQGGQLPPSKSVNHVETKVTVPDGKYIVLGGLTTQTESMTVSKVPLLGDVPLLGALFRSSSRSEVEAVLYVFVKANIVRSEDFSDLDSLTEDFRNKLRQSELNYLKQSAVIPGLPDMNRQKTGTFDDPAPRGRIIKFEDMSNTVKMNEKFINNNSTIQDLDNKKIRGPLFWSNNKDK